MNILDHYNCRSYNLPILVGQICKRDNYYSCTLLSRLLNPSTSGPQPITNDPGPLYCHSTTLLSKRHRKQAVGYLPVSAWLYSKTHFLILLGTESYEQMLHFTKQEGKVFPRERASYLNKTKGSPRN